MKTSIKQFRGNKRRVLEWLHGMVSGRALELQVVASGLGDAVDDLRSDGLIERFDDEAVKSGGVPAPALRLTKAGRALFGAQPDAPEIPKARLDESDKTTWEPSLTILSRKLDKIGQRSKDLEALVAVARAAAQYVYAAEPEPVRMKRLDKALVALQSLE